MKKKFLIVAVFLSLGRFWPLNDTEARCQTAKAAPAPTAEPVQLNNDSPPVFYSSSPAILMIVDGDPVLSPIEKNDMEFVVNTNRGLFFDKKKKEYYLLVNNAWLTANDLN